VNDAQRCDVRALLPDAALDVPETGRHKVNGGLLYVDDQGAFTRCLLPVALTGDFELVLGTWMKISHADMKHAEAVWDDAAMYAGLVLHGTLANSIKPWGEDMLGAAVTAVVRNTDEIPYVDASDNQVIRAVLRDVWDRDQVLRCFGHPLPVDVRTPLTDEWSIERTAGLAARVVDGTSQFAGPGRTVYVDLLTDWENRPPEVLLESLLEGAPEVPLQQTFTTRAGDLLRHAFWLTAAHEQQHEFYAYVVRPGSALAIGCFYDDPADHAWAMHVLQSAAYQAK
jgi:hypothetical protein